MKRDRINTEAPRSSERKRSRQQLRRPMMTEPESIEDFEDKLQDHVMSAQASLHDIDRWLMQALANGRISKDRRGDIVHAANRIAELAKKL